MCEALLTLHAIADEACSGLGIALTEFGGKGCVYRARGGTPGENGIARSNPVTLPARASKSPHATEWYFDSIVLALCVRARSRCRG